MNNLEKVMYEKIRYYNDVFIFDILHDDYSENHHEEFKQFHKNTLWLLKSSVSEDRFGELTPLETASTQFLLYALWMVDLNAEDYYKYFNVKKESSYRLRRNILFNSGFDNPDSWETVTIKDLQADRELSRTFIDPIAYCDYSLSEDEYTREAIRNHGVQNLALDELFKIYVDSLNK
ncbi:hypothetical protein HB904_03785 [Listeria booriae]|uniref:Uncharacterized protein n=1 Tax=Listeria booriae TaxID=1552123 RepID=A0A842AFF1_9LIST|nr:hypothetical protein [Listeria booriae]MBC1615292.1 hypothetical protein [Listeria booriae]